MYCPHAIFRAEFTGERTDLVMQKKVVKFGNPRQKQTLKLFSSNVVNIFFFSREDTKKNNFVPGSS